MINRRKFITYMAGGVAVTLGGLQLVKGDALANKITPNASKLTHKPKLFCVFGSNIEARAVQQHLRDNPHFDIDCVNPGVALHGIGADLIIVDGGWKSDYRLSSTIVQQHCDDWYNSVLRTRLMPDAQIIPVEFMEKQMDFGNSIGLGASWYLEDIPGGTRMRHAVKFDHRQGRPLTGEETAMGKAKLIEHYLNQHAEREFYGGHQWQPWQREIWEALERGETLKIDTGRRRA